MTQRWRLLLAGQPRLSADAQPSPTIALARKDAGWLAYVAAQPQTPSAALAALLWPDTDARGALNNLRQRVHRLRRATGARLVEMTETIALAADLAAPAPERAALVADPAAWDGELLGAYEYDDAPEFAAWLAAARHAAHEARRETLAAFASEAERDGEIARALVYAHRLLADDALSEHAHRRLMRLHYLRGDSAAAIAAFEICERTLKAELGVKPSAETIALLQVVEQGGRMVADGARPVRPLPASLLRPPRLVGRDPALAELALASQQVPLAVVVGEAGIGKTRLLQELLAECGDTASHISARPGDAAAPYATLGRLLQALRDAGTPMPGALAPLLAPAETTTPMTTTQRLRSALEACLGDAAARGLRTVVVDDLHFADPASTEMLLAVALGDALPALRWIIAQRPDGAAAESALQQALPQSPQVRFVTLAPLDATALEAFVASLGIAAFDARALAAPLARRTGGNPLFVIETLRATLLAPPSAAGTLARPAGLSHLIDERLRRLSRPALALARVAAIAAPDFDLALAEAVLGAPAVALADAWHELESAQMLRGEAFAHDLVHEALLRATPQVIAAHMHRQVAAVLARRDIAPARLAQHWLAGGEARAAAAAFARAALLATAAGRPREQAELLEQCAAAHDAAGDTEAALRARIDRIDPLLQDRGTDAALVAADALVAASRTSPLAARALTARALALAWDGRGEPASEAACQALEIARADDDEVRVTATAILANTRAMGGDTAGALALLQPWRARIDDVADAAVQREFFGNLTNLLLQANRAGEALAVAQRHLELARQTGHGGDQLAALMNLSNLHGRRGDLEPAIEHGRAADRLLPETEQAVTLGPWNQASLGYWLAGSGRFDEALDLLEGAVAALARGNPVQRQLAQGVLARVWVTLGQTARALALLREMPEVPRGRLRCGQLAVRARVQQALGGDAAPLWRAAIAEGAAGDYTRLGAEVALAAGDAVALAALQQQAEGLEYFPIAAEAATLRVQVLGGQTDAVTIGGVERLALAARSPAFYLPEQLARCADAYRCIGRRDDERRCIEAALDWVHRQALPHLPAPFVEGFLHRNPTNVALRAAAAQLASSTTTGA